MHGLQRDYSFTLLYLYFR